MICTLVSGALLTIAASHIDNIAFRASYDDGPRYMLKQNHDRLAFIKSNNVEVNTWPREVRVVISGDIALIVDDERFTSADNLVCE